jgi:hypothetical protein
MRNMVSAINSAIDNWRMRLTGARFLRQRNGVGHHQFVELRAVQMRSMALPDSTGCVQ